MLFRDLGARAAAQREDSQIVEIRVFARAVVYLYPAGNAVTSTSGTIPPFHYLCEGVLPWYHTSFSTS